MKRIFPIIFSLIMILLFSGCCLSHTWIEPGCTTPQTCATCSKTKGTPLGHQWEEATCIAPKTCSRCGLKEGALLAHQWTEATCTQARTCTVCRLTEGAKLSHTFGEEVQQHSDYVNATANFTRTCSVCGMQSQRNEALETFTDGKTFLMTPEEFSDRLSAMLQEMDYILNEGQYFSAIYNDGSIDTLKLYIAKTNPNGKTWIVGEFEMYDTEENLLLHQQKDTANLIWKVQGTVYDKDSALLTALALWSTGNTADTLKQKASTYAKINLLSGNTLDVHTKISMYSMPTSKDISCKVSKKGDDSFELTLKVLKRS